MVIKGKYNTAKIYTEVMEESARMQIQALCDSEVFDGCKVRVMPDVHAGAGCTIGTTMTIRDKVVPNMVGVDIGCGMEVVELAEKEMDFAALDAFIYENIPSGMNHRKTRHAYAENVSIDRLACAKSVHTGKGYLSVGTLGGGNHFIEVDKDEKGNLYLVVHSGSRHLGLEVAEYYQKAAVRYHKNNARRIADIISTFKKQGRTHEIQAEIERLKSKGVTVSEDEFVNQYVEGELFIDYIHDMQIMQRFADWNRRAMTDAIVSGLGLRETGRFTTVHNYIDTENMILRKGAVSAQKGERLLVPINMRDGSLICIGKGNSDWNYSAPHGAGRLMSRNKARETLSLDQFRAEMKGIYSTSINKNTIDESPMAYKRIEDIVDNIKPTVKIERRIYPVYNFKAAEDSRDAWRKKK